MKARTSEMPMDDIIVYCVLCIQSVAIGGKHPRYLPDLLLGLNTQPKIYETEVWHRELMSGLRGIKKNLLLLLLIF